MKDRKDQKSVDLFVTTSYFFNPILVQDFNPPACDPKKETQVVPFASATQRILPGCVPVMRCGGCCRADQNCVAATKQKKQVNVFVLGIFSKSSFLSPTRSTIHHKVVLESIL